MKQLQLGRNGSQVSAYSVRRSIEGTLQRLRVEFVARVRSIAGAKGSTMVSVNRE
jgi:hypothetical protein